MGAGACETLLNGFARGGQHRTHRIRKSEDLFVDGRRSEFFSDRGRREASTCLLERRCNQQMRSVRSPRSPGASQIIHIPAVSDDGLPKSSKITYRRTVKRSQQIHRRVRAPLWAFGGAAAAARAASICSGHHDHLKHPAQRSPPPPAASGSIFPLLHDRRKHPARRSPPPPQPRTRLRLASRVLHCAENEVD